MSQRRKAKKKSGKLGMTIMGIMAFAICGFLIYQTMQLDEQKKDMELTLSGINQKIENAQVEGEALKTQKKYMETDEYIRDKAKELGLVDPDDIIIKTDTDGNSSVQVNDDASAQVNDDSVQDTEESE